MLHRLRSLLVNLTRPARFDRRLDGEMEGFVEMLEAEHRARGLSPDEARRRALIDSGGATQVKESVRDIRTGASLELLGRDIRLATRKLLRSPAFTLTTTITLALGLGATVVVLAIADAVLLRPLGYAEADRLVTVLQHGNDPVSPASYLAWKSTVSATMRVEAAEYWTPTLGDGEAEKVDGLHVTPGMMRMLGVAPALGSGFTGGDDAREVLLGDALWRRRFGADKSVIGRTIIVDGAPLAVVGVMPRGFQFAPFWATHAQLWAPLPLAGKTTSRGQSLRVFGRLADGVSLARAQSQIDLASSRLAVTDPEGNKDIRVLSLKEKAIGNARPALYALAGAVAFVLLILWVNVAHMLVARAYTRERELRLRVALGAGRFRLLRETLIESALLAIVGGTLALGLASVSLDLVAIQGPFDLPQLTTLGLDGRVGLIAGALVAVTSVILAVLPASLANAAASSPTLRHNTRESTPDGSRTRLRQLLTASEMAFALVLLVGTALMVRTFASMRAVDPGFDAAGLVTMQVPVPATAQSATERMNYFGSVADRVKAIPGVSGAGFINHLPLSGDEWGAPAFGGVNENGKEGEGVRSVYRVITPGLLSTMRISIEEGRDVLPTDAMGATPVVIINRRLARRLWPDESAVGKRLTFAAAGSDREWTTVIGVAENVKQSQWTSEASEEVYLPYAQNKVYLEGNGGATKYLTLVVRTSQAPASAVSAVRAIAASVDRTRPITDVATMTEVVDQVTARARFLMDVLLGFGTLAVLLAAVGIYGVMSYSVAERRQEIGIRMALGADAMTISRAVVGQAGLTVGAGLAVGSVAALALTQFVAGQLYGVSPRDPVSFAAATVVLAVTAILATVGPLLKARRVDPLSAMRVD
jgi:putative ABC transport system permease protein